MKKLMITLTAAMVTSVIMAATPAAQVYDVSLKIKTTSAATATVNNKTNPLAVGSDEEPRSIVYRKQSTTTWKGIIWGCGCESINGRWETVVNDCGEEVIQLDTVKGCILWDVKTKEPVYIGCGSDLKDVSSVPGSEFGWNFIHCINKDGKQVEGSWIMSQNGDVCGEDSQLFEFVGSGFGSAAISTEDGDVSCISYIKNISGEFAGWMKAPSKYTTTSWTGCTYCGFSGGETSCDLAEAWQWCDWNNYCSCDTGIEENPDYTTAYGTWNIKYNPSLSKKLSQPVVITEKEIKGVVVSIRDVYDFSKLPHVEEAIKSVEHKIWGVKTECDVLAENLAKAEKSYADAKKNVEDVSTASLLAKIAETRNDYISASNAVESAVSAQSASNSAYSTAKSAYEAQCSFVTNNNWSISYVNMSQLTAVFTGKGLESFDNTIEELKGFTLVSVEYEGAGEINPTYADAKSFVANETAELSNLLSDMESAYAGLEYANTVVAVAEIAKTEAKSEYDTALVNYEDRTTLQLLANQRLAISEVALEKARSEYEESHCN